MPVNANLLFSLQISNISDENFGELEPDLRVKIYILIIFPFSKYHLPLIAKDVWSAVWHRLDYRQKPDQRPRDRGPNDETLLLKSRSQDRIRM